MDLDELDLHVRASTIVICDKGTYPVYMSSPYIYRINELIKFIKKSKIIHTCSFHLTPSMYKILTSNS
jgi:hypothetical protein